MFKIAPLVALFLSTPKLQFASGILGVMPEAFLSILAISIFKKLPKKNHHGKISKSVFWLYSPCLACIAKQGYRGYLIGYLMFQ